jgi:hypothetical protein
MFLISLRLSTRLPDSVHSVPYYKGTARLPIIQIMATNLIYRHARKLILFLARPSLVAFVPAGRESPYSRVPSRADAIRIVLTRATFRQLRAVRKASA